MTKEIAQPQTPETLVKTSAEGSVELSEAELQQVAGGKDKPKDFLVVTMKEVFIS